MPDESQGADRGLDLIDRLVRPIALYAGGLAVVGMAVLTVVAVTFRYAFNSPIFGADDFNQILLLSTVAFAVAHSGRTGGQVTVEILGTVSGPRFTRWSDILVKSIGAVMMAILVWQLIKNGIKAPEYGETTLSLEISLGPFFMVLAFGMALYGAVLIVELVAQYRGREVSHKTESSQDL